MKTILIACALCASGVFAQTVESYRIVANINDQTLSGSERVMFALTEGEQRSLPMKLGATLHVTEAVISSDQNTWSPVQATQGAITFPQPLKAGRYVLKMTWSGPYQTNWYPNLGGPANYELSFHVPASERVVAAGEEISNRVDGGIRISEWKSIAPLRSVEISSGRILKGTHLDRSTGVIFEIYQPEPPELSKRDTHAEVDMVPESTDGFLHATQKDGFHRPRDTTSDYRVQLSPGKPAEEVERTISWLFGAPKIVRIVPGRDITLDWWSDQIAPGTDRDAWLSSGFAEFIDAIASQRQYGNAAYLTKLEHASKGAHVLHMLRMLMKDYSKQDPDEDFVAMTKDFAATYRGKIVSTEDFQRIVAKHMTRNGGAEQFFRQWIYGDSIPKLDATTDVTDIGGGKYHITVTITQSQVRDDFTTYVPLYATFGDGKIARLALVPITGSTTKPFAFDLALPTKPASISINAMHDVRTQ